MKSSRTCYFYHSLLSIHKVGSFRLNDHRQVNNHPFLLIWVISINSHGRKESLIASRKRPIPLPEHLTGNISNSKNPN